MRGDGRGQIDERAELLELAGADTLLTGEAIRGRRLRRRRRILLTHRQMALQFGDMFRLLRDLPTQLLILASPPPQLFRVGLAPICHASNGTPIAGGVQAPLNCYAILLCPESATATLNCARLPTSAPIDPPHLRPITSERGS